MTPIKLGAALVAAGALSIGAVACGSDSSSDSTGSASPAPIQKEAGAATGMIFSVPNNSQEAVTLRLCGDGDCGEHQLQPDRQDAVIATDVYGTITYPDGRKQDFIAQNLSPAEPYIELAGFRFELSEGEQKGFGGGNESALNNGGKGNYYYTVKRSPDYIADSGDTQKSSPGGDVVMSLSIDGLR